MKRSRCSAGDRDRLQSRVALLLVAAACLAGCGKEKPPPPPPPPEVPVAAPVQRDVPVYVELVGQTRGSEDVEVPARVEGWLQGIHFREGSEVPKGALLYTIDPQPMLQEVASAEGRLAAARAQAASATSQVAAAQAQVGEAQAQLAGAEGDVSKFRPLAELKAISRRDLDNAVARRDAAKERLGAAKEVVEAARGAVRAAQGQVDAASAQVGLTKIRLGYTKVYAPISGLIGQTKAQVGDLVGRAPLIVLNTISTIDPIFVDFSLNERQYLEMARRLGGRQPGRTTGLELLLADGSTYSERGSVNFANRQVDPSTGTLLIQASFPNPSKILRPGQFGRVRGVTEVKRGALLVPQKAVQELQGQHQLFVVGPGDRVAVRNVKMGQRTGELWVVDEGLGPGERVVLEGSERLKAGMRVVPRPALPAGTPQDVPRRAETEGGAR